jgi:hypothetical protein
MKNVVLTYTVNRSDFYVILCHQCMDMDKIKLYRVHKGDIHTVFASKDFIKHVTLRVSFNNILIKLTSSISITIPIASLLCNISLLTEPHVSHSPLFLQNP